MADPAPALSPLRVAPAPVDRDSVYNGAASIGELTPGAPSASRSPAGTRYSWSMRSPTTGLAVCREIIERASYR